MMERDFELSFLTGEEASSDSSYNAIFSDGTLQSLIPRSTNYSSSSSSSSFNFFSEDFPALTHNKPQQLPVPFNFKTPKNEPFNPPDSTFELTQPFDFFSDSPFNHLPHLHSLEQSQLTHSSTYKRPRVDDSPQNLDSILHQTYNPRPVVPNSELARQRRQKISDKTRCLQKLMPWDKKMDTATMLQEAYKYVQFLQAQIGALQSMPLESSFSTQNDGRFVGGLGRLNRQQLLQVMVNSPVAQTMLYSKGFCVFSMEQLVLLKKAAARRAALKQVLLHDPSWSC